MNDTASLSVAVRRQLKILALLLPLATLFVACRDDDDDHGRDREEFELENEHEPAVAGFTVSVSLEQLAAMPGDQLRIEAEAVAATRRWRV